MWKKAKQIRESCYQNIFWKKKIFDSILSTVIAWVKQLRYWSLYTPRCFAQCKGTGQINPIQIIIISSSIYCYLTVPRPTLGHSWGTTSPTFNHCVYKYFDPRPPGALEWGWGPKPGQAPSVVWNRFWEGHDTSLTPLLLTKEKYNQIIS